MHLIYVDDSRDEKLCVFSALAIPAGEWRNAFTAVRRFRQALHETDSIFTHVEFHAWRFVSGRGRLADRIVTKWRRCQLFAATLDMVAALPGAGLFNAVFAAKDNEPAFERLLTHINQTMQAWDSHAILICDEGKNAVHTRLARRLAGYDPIRSQYGVGVDTGGPTESIPTERILEDPFLKDSEHSYFIQLADFCAYALLRRERPVASKTKYGLDRAFTRLLPILVREANQRDPEGIIRP